MTPFHFHHFTPMGLAMNAVQAGFEIVEMGQWGNQDYGTNLLGLLGWPDYKLLAAAAKKRGAVDADGEPFIVNDRNSPAQVWALVRRPWAS